MTSINKQGCLYGVTANGKVVQLYNNVWSELENAANPDLCFKRISCCPLSLWAIGGDHQVYVRLLESDIPLCIKEESYENQRWNPMDGFCGKLLPTDRPHFSSVDGLTDRALDCIKLPSSAWSWENDWHLELQLEGESLDTEGWTYAVDFPRNYAVSKYWNSCVRRRKWIRNRRYTAVQTWTMISRLEKDDLLEPFIDVSVGGYNLPGTVPGSLSVWAVTINGTLLYRKGVNSLCPEGTSWIPVETPLRWEPCQVSISSSGVVWILAWNGQILTRYGITKDQELGTGWYEVQPPYQGLTFSHIALGPNSAWAVTRENEVWFRKGLDSSVLGVGWTSMVDPMGLIFAGPENQVCGISVQDQKLYFRIGIRSEEITGKMWKMVVGAAEIPLMWVSFDCQGSIVYLEDSTDTSTESWREEILQHLRQRRQFHEDFKDYPNAVEGTEWIKTGQALFLGQWVTLHLRWTEIPLLIIKDISLTAQEIVAVRCEAERCLVVYWWMKSSLKLTFVSEEEVEDWAAHLTKACWLARNLVGNFSNSIWLLSSEGDAFFHETSVPKLDYIEEDDYYYFDVYNKTSQNSKVFIQDIPDGFYRGCSITLSGKIPDQAQRFSINFQCGPKIQPHEALSSKRDVAFHLNPRFESGCQVVRNSFSNGYWNAEEKDGSFDLQPGSDFIIKILCLRQHFKVSINNLHLNFAHRIPAMSITHFVVKGDVNLFSISYGVPKKSYIPTHLLWTQIGGHFRHVEASRLGIIWALGEDGKIWIHSGSPGGGVLKGILGSTQGLSSMTDESSIYIYENQRWNPVYGFSSRGLPTDRPSWSDSTGRKAYSKESVTLCNRRWSWTSDWLIDYHPPEGADRDGWQYATDFPSSYHPNKGAFDYVRRRRWFRQCRFSTTGPWIQFGMSKFQDISLQMDKNDDSGELALWAIAGNGTIMRRIGVTVNNPQGEQWEAVLSENTFKSVSVGVTGRIWAVTSDGQPTLRHGVTHSSPNGLAWLLLDRPEGIVNLQQISAGDVQVWAIDTQNRLYRRKDVVPILPEGTTWELIEHNVQHVSVGPNDQVWAVLDTDPYYSKVNENGTVCIRSGITRSNPAGTGWEYVIGGGYSHICCRGYDIPHL